jgi:hypothetical protein
VRFDICHKTLKADLIVAVGKHGGSAK